ncbi:DUF1642 domain-containing protein [Streptococcus suis]|uniref:DUF1642 domain-containing protein n=1 Tax=Streptococcus suis R61 TaxID=996306 RepID=A0AA87F9B8_STRSU|nr:DUF1642 domain-containing protein [Streptococcus suis]ANM47462.1 hypothetical protein [Streptococcus phage phiJH1301-1]EHC03004.1 hypothetical protein SSUR61_1002 [Streptococcus suis R61]MBY4981788.1 DUF1642 domain-containing protein [Streptococcus suis]MBY4992534.1 DUF1642 domain-containing protein [Streptococcus suis]MBY5001634.1 DUF1642 domain-containing protein [Streptococcus suis]
MNKQEFKKQAEMLYTDVRSFLDNTFEIINQIHEPQKVVVPKFVAEWIERTKSVDWSFKVALNNPIDSVYGWLANRNNQETFARAWLFGYEIEQEKLYTVEIPNPNRTTEPIIYLSRDEEGKIFLNNWFLHVSQNWKNQPHAQLTETEIKKDFGWAWQFAKEVE